MTINGLLTDHEIRKRAMTGTPWCGRLARTGCRAGGARTTVLVHSLAAGVLLTFLLVLQVLQRRPQLQVAADDDAVARLQWRQVQGAPSRAGDRLGDVGV